MTIRESASHNTIPGVVGYVCYICLKGHRQDKDMSDTIFKTTKQHIAELMGKNEDNR